MDPRQELLEIYKKSPAGPCLMPFGRMRQLLVNLKQLSKRQRKVPWYFWQSGAMTV